MGNVLFVLAYVLDLLDLMVTDADWVGAKIHLFMNDYTPDEDTVLADMTVANYTGYAAQTLVWSAAFFDLDGTPVSSAGEKLFIQTGATGATIYGFWITDTAGTKLLAAGRLADAPYPMTVNGSTLPLSVKIGIRDGLVSVAATP